MAIEHYSNAIRWPKFSLSKSLCLLFLDCIQSPTKVGAIWSIDKRIFLHFLVQVLVRGQAGEKPLFLVCTYYYTWIIVLH